MAQRIIAFDDTEERLVRTTKDPANVGTASSTGESVNAGSETVTNGATSKSLTYANAFSNTSYAVVAQLGNTVDSLVQYQPLLITSKSTSGCTVSWNVPADSANYTIDFIAADPCITYRGGDLNIGSSASSISFDTFWATPYAMIGQHHNDFDSLPLFQPSVWTIQEAVADSALLTPKAKNLWNVTTDTNSYDFEFLCNQANCSTTASYITKVSNGASSTSINFPFFNLESSNYAVAARFLNNQDNEANIVYQPITVTSKSVSGFTAKWNTPVSSSNYKIEWICHMVTTP
jgi:hypothetical protein